MRKQRLDDAPWEVVRKFVPNLHCICYVNNPFQMKDEILRPFWPLTPRNSTATWQQSQDVLPEATVPSVWIKKSHWLGLGSSRQSFSVEIATAFAWRKRIQIDIFRLICALFSFRFSFHLGWRRAPRILFRVWNRAFASAAKRVPAESIAQKKRVLVKYAIGPGNRGSVEAILMHPSRANTEQWSQPWCSAGRCSDESCGESVG